MRLPHIANRFAAAWFAALLLPALPGASFAQERGDLRVVEQDISGYRDIFVDRNGPFIYDITGETEFDQGQLGVLLPSYDRAHLYLAYRALTHSPAELEKQFKNTPPDEFLHRRNNRSRVVESWLAARAESTAIKVPRKILQYHRVNGFSTYLNCGDGAFTLAIDTLHALAQNRQVTPPDVQSWIAAQDAVFDQCSDINGAPVLKLPQELDAAAPRYLQQLRQYQVAAANFYRGNYAEALTRFDAIVAGKGHPMRAWAALGAMRALLRMGTTDDTVARKLEALNAAGATGPDQGAAFDLAAAENQRNMKQLDDKIAARGKAILADKSLAAVHEPVRKLLRQAESMLLPEEAYATMTAELGRFDKDYRIEGELFHWATVGNQLFDRQRHADLIASLRRRHEYFDWIRTVQGCTDAPWSPNFAAGRCEAEQQHAQERWQAGKGKAWLLATLMTAQRITPTVQKAFDSAARVGPSDETYLTLRYNAARVLRLAGRFDDARAIIDEVMQPPNFSISGSILKNAADANNLFRQEALALAKNDQEALPYLLRQSSRRLGIDGDELLNRRLASEDLLRLAENPIVDSDLAEQLVVAAWWRADMVGKKATAERAARMIVTRVPNLAMVANDYLHADSDAERHFVVAKAALHYRISPRVYAVTKNFAERSAPRDVQFWCSFDSSDYAFRAAVERMPAALPELTADPGARNAELTALHKVGSGADWMGRIALSRAANASGDANVRVMLQAAAKSGNRNCGSPEGAVIANAARQLVGDAAPDMATELARRRARRGEVQSTPAVAGNTVVSEAEARAYYDRAKAASVGRKEYHVAHIMYRSESEAAAAIASIRGGASFEQLAKASLDTGSAGRGGDLDWSLPNAFVKPFADVVMSINAPTLYDRPVQTPFGWHVIRVLGIRPYVMPEFETVRPAIEQQIRKQRSQ